jgi:hypothetical protein
MSDEKPKPEPASGNDVGCMTLTLLAWMLGMLFVFNLKMNELVGAINAVEQRIIDLGREKR